jgi:nitrate reductase NapE
MDDSPQEKRQELKAFLFLTVVMAPAIAGTVIVVYGFAVWIFQMFAGPPGS